MNLIYKESEPCSQDSDWISKQMQVLYRSLGRSLGQKPNSGLVPKGSTPLMVHCDQFSQRSYGQIKPLAIDHSKCVICHREARPPAAPSCSVSISFSRTPVHQIFPRSPMPRHNYHQLPSPRAPINDCFMKSLAEWQKMLFVPWATFHYGPRHIVDARQHIQNYITGDI